MTLRRFVSRLILSTNHQNFRCINQEIFFYKERKFQEPAKEEISRHFPYFGLKETDERPSLRPSFSKRKLNHVMKLLRTNEPVADEDLVFLYYLPHLCFRFDDLDAFLPVLGVWWKRTLPYLEKNTVKISSVLIHLGKLQEKFPDMSIAKEIGGWKSIDFLLNRMLEIGFHRFPCKDVNSAMSGLFLLLCFPLSNAEQLRPIHVKELKIFHPWLRAVHGYFSNKSPSDFDWDHLHYDATVSLSMFRKFDSQPPNAVLSRLCQFCKAGFDKSIAIDDFDLWQVSLINYGDAFLWFNVDPDRLAAGSWRGWFSTWRRLLDEWNRRGGKNLPNLQLIGLKYLCGVALTFGRPEEFKEIFDSWCSALTRLLSDEFLETLEDAETHVADMIYTLGLLASRFDSFRKMQSMRKVVAYLQNAFERLDAKEITFLGINRALSGMKSLKEADARDFNPTFPFKEFPSKEFLRVIQRRFAYENQLTDKNCVKAAEIILLLKRLDCTPTIDLIDSLLRVISDELDRVESRKLEKILCYSGEAAVFFQIEFERSDQFIDCVDEFWPKWFSAAERFLQHPIYSSPDDFTSKMSYLLDRIIVAAKDARRLSEFSQVQPLWEKRLLEILAAGLEQKWRKNFLCKVCFLIDNDSWKFDSALLEKLGYS